MYAIETVFKLFPLDKNIEGSEAKEDKPKKKTPENDFFSSCFQEACNDLAQEMGYPSKKRKS